MDNKEFDRLQVVSKECWAELSLTGDTEKPDRMFKYLNSCPACQVANGDCRRCPADLWRAIALENEKAPYYEPGDPICDECNQWFFIWRSTGDLEERREMARRISCMNWTFIPELHNEVKRTYRVEVEVSSTEVHIVEAHSCKEAEDIAQESLPGAVYIDRKKIRKVDLA